MTKITVTLYWAEWCKYCTEFKPIWEELKNKVSEDKDIASKIEFKDFEESRDKEETKNINGFPTIFIGDEQYNEQRTLLNLMSTIKKKLNIQNGGDQDNYFYKYLKYKTKYYNLLKNYK